MDDWHVMDVEQKSIELAILKELQRQGMVYANLVTGKRNHLVFTFYVSLTAGDEDSHDEMTRRYPGMTTIEPLRIDRQIEALEKLLSKSDT